MTAADKSLILEGLNCLFGFSQFKQSLYLEVLLNLFVPNGIPLSYQLDRSISVIRVVGWHYSFS